MKNTTLSLICGAMLGLSLGGCALDYIPTEDDLKNKFMVEWIKSNGLIDPDQDWNMATTVTATIRPETFGEGYTVRVYSEPLERGGVYIGEVDTAMEVEMNLLKSDTELYVRAYNPEGTHYVEGTYPIVDGHVEVAALSRAVGELVEDDGSPRSRAQVVEAETDYQWIIACEDLGSTAGTDMDFNDVVIGINYTFQNNLFRLSVTPLAAGGIFRATVYLGSETENDRPLEANKLFEIHQGVTGYLPDDIATGSYQMYNTTYFDRPGKTHVIEKNEPFFNIAENMGNINIWVDFPNGSKLPGAMITGPTPGTSPQMICVKGGWLWPKECRQLSDAYPNFRQWNKDVSLTTWTEKMDPALIVPRGTSTTPDPDPVRTVNVHQEGVYNRSVAISGSYNLNASQTVTYTERPYDVYVGDGVALENAPVVFSLHGAYGSKNSQEPIKPADADKRDNHADDEAFIVVYPSGVTQYMPGIGGYATGWAADGTVNVDVDYLKAIIADLKADEAFSIDESRIYVCGFSNGGMMTYSLANCATDVFAAFAAVTGYQINEFHQTYYGPTTVPFLHIHGMDDYTVKYGYVKSIRDNMIARMGCNPKGVVSTTITPDGSKKTVYESAGGNVPYIFYEMAGMDHRATYTINDQSSGRVIWDFFRNKDNNRSQNTLKTDWNTSLKWQLNPDMQYNGDLWAYGWKLVDNNMAVEWGAKNHTDENTAINGQTAIQANVYRSIELAPGDYVFEFETTGSNDYYVRMEELNNGSVPLSFKATGATTGKMPFHVHSKGTGKLPYSEFKIKKRGSGMTFKQFRIVSKSGNVVATNCQYDHIPGGTFTPIPMTTVSSGGTTVNVNGDVTEYTSTGDIQVAFKNTTAADLDVTGCDYVVIKFAEPTTTAWSASFFAGETTTVDIPIGSLEFVYYIPEGVTTLPQATLIHLWGSTGTAKVLGCYKHK